MMIEHEGKQYFMTPKITKNCKGCINLYKPINKCPVKNHNLLCEPGQNKHYIIIDIKEAMK